MIQEYLNSVDKFIVVGDRVLIKPREMETPPPASVKEKEEVQSGYIIKTGPGYAVPSSEEDEPWKESKNEPRYIGMQAQKGDLAIYLKNGSFEIEFENEKYLIVPHSAILLLIRDEHTME